MTERGASIDDLLGSAEEIAAPAARRPRSGLGWLLRTLLAAGGLTAVTVVGLRVFGVGLPVLAIFAGYLALLALRRLVGGVAPPPHPAALPRDPAFDDGTYRWGAEDALGGAVHRWARQIAWARDNPQRFASQAHPLLVELVDERLRQRHGVSRSTDPERARTLLGEPLWTFLATPPKRSPAPRDLVALVAEVEKI